MYKMVFKNLLLISILFVAMNCMAGNTDLNPEANRKVVDNAPEWFKTNPEEEGFKFETASATSQDMQLAIDKARVSASTAMAGTVQAEYNGLAKSIKEETGREDDSDILDRFSQVQEQVIASSLGDLEVAKKEIYAEKTKKGKNIYRAYVLVKWNEGAAQERLLNRIKADKEIYEAIRASELYQEMEEKVEKYREKYSD